MLTLPPSTKLPRLSAPIKKALLLLFFVSAMGSAFKAHGQEKYLFALDSTTGRESRIRFQRTRIFVKTQGPEEEYFRDKIKRVDGKGIYFVNNGFYPFSKIDLIRFKPYTKGRQYFMPVYYIVTLNGFFFTTIAAEDGWVPLIMIALSPFWAGAAPWVLKGMLVMFTPNELIEVSKTKFETGSKSPFQPVYE